MLIVSCDLQEVVGGPDVSLEGGSAGEITAVECVGLWGVGKEVVSLGGVGLVGLVEGVQVAGGRGVDQVDLAAVLLLLRK